MTKSVLIVTVIGCSSVFAMNCREVRSQDCSATDDQIRTQYQQASLKALLNGELNRFVNLQTTLSGQLSPSCRRRLNQLEPMRASCTAQEKREVLEHYISAMRAAQLGNIMLILDYWENLEATVSPQCWLAANRHTDAQLVDACSVTELNHLASFASPVLRATRDMLSTLDPTPLLQLSQNMMGRLSQSCSSALARFQQAAQQTQNPARIYGPPNVLDHGGGTYSVPGTGACTPSGCMAY